MDNRHCARRPSSRALLEADGPIFLSPSARLRGAPGATKKGGVGESRKMAPNDGVNTSRGIRYFRFRICTRNNHTLSFRGCHGAIATGLLLWGARKGTVKTEFAFRSTCYASRKPPGRHQGRPLLGYLMRYSPGGGFPPQWNF